ncbi:hypothetical protein OSB04_010219 [Centaurea solstitialis]|uniref:Uncharacterized protein n=1 Tax=Centaurea solstitialis TaxID=347529 RepID=A0AA38WKF2_9ASTR|nr:hypothetical protein OSB04_010219 [Centaurea solstitialis]
MLQSEPSFSIYADEDGFVENEKGDLEGCEFSFAKRRSMGLIVEGNEDDDDHKLKEPPSPKMYLATGLGIDGFNDIEEEEYYYYKMMMMSKGDVTEDDYLSATLIEDPNDGETLMQYAKLVWEVHHDQDRALTYFERAVYASPGDCNILAAYASFLWDIDQVQDEDYKTLEVEENSPQRAATGVGANVDGLSQQ